MPLPCSFITSAIALIGIASTSLAEPQAKVTPHGEAPPLLEVADEEALRLIESFGMRVLPADFSDRTTADYDRELRAWMTEHLEAPYFEVLRASGSTQTKEITSFVSDALDHLYLPPVCEDREHLDPDRPTCHLS